MARRLPIPSTHVPPEALAEVRRFLDRGGVAAVPTDTLYGLAANALRADAVARVFALKGRSFQNPLPLVVRDAAQVEALARALPPLFYRLAADFWPGPLTLVVAAGPHLPPELTAGFGTVGVRQPNLPLLAELLCATGYPLTATSANRSGQPACRTAAEVEAQLGADCELIVDAGPSPSALPSTLVDLTQPTPCILRAGAIPADRLRPYW